jgi:hypothetical protein
LRPASSASSTTVARASDGGVDEEVSAGHDLDLDAMLTARMRLHDWRNSFFGARIENPPIKARARRVPQRGSFRLEAVAEIRAYHYRRDFTVGNVPDSYGELEYTDLPFTKDGRIDGHVVPPEAILTEAERDRVLGLVRAAVKAYDDVQRHGGSLRPVLRCGFDPHHVFVFFDQAGAPVARIDVCFTCSEVTVRPAMAAFDNGDPSVMTDDERSAFREIADAHNLGAWTYGETPEGEALAAYEGRLYYTKDRDLTAEGKMRQARIDDIPSGVPGDLTPKTASKADVDRFCVWLGAEIGSRHWRRPSPTGGFECGNGQTYAFGSATASAMCEAKQLCNAPFGKMETCLRKSFFVGPELVCHAGVDPSCEGLLNCLPSLRWGLPAAPPSAKPAPSAKGVPRKRVE